MVIIIQFVTWVRIKSIERRRIHWEIPTILEKELPGAWGDAFLVHEPKDLRKEKFDAHTRGPVMYLGPNIKTKDGHIFYDPITKKLLTRRSYRRMNGVPPEWLHVRTTDTFNNDDLSQVYDDYDIWHRGATYITTALQIVVFGIPEMKNEKLNSDSRFVSEFRLPMDGIWYGI